MRVLLVCAALAGCAVSPDYVAPHSGAPAHWQAETHSRETSLATPSFLAVENPTRENRGVETQAWWTLFGDPVLDELVREALTNDFSVRQAEIRIASARAERASVRAGSLPAISAGFGASRQENVFPGLPNQRDFSLFDAGFDARWELDIFGRTRRRVEAAEARVGALDAAREGARVVLAAEVVRIWAALHADAQSLDLLRKSIELAENVRQLETRRQEIGTGTRREVLTAATRVEQLRALSPSLESAITGGRRQLELLLARPPGALDALLDRSGAARRAIPLDHLLATPAEVLARRPDVQRAERELAVASALRGAAIADRYPRISLGLLLGLANTSIGTLFTGPSHALLAGGQIFAPVFDGGRLRAAVDMSDAAVAAAALSFEETSLRALHEVEMNLDRALAAERRDQALTKALGLQRESVRIARRRYTAGAGDRIALLEARLAFLDAERQQREALRERQVTTAALCKSLGLGLVTPSAAP